MTSKTLNRSSLLLIISGILLAGAMIFHPDMGRPGYAAAASWVPVHIALGFSTFFGLIGLAGLFSVMNLRIRRFGKAAFALAMTGNLLLTGILFFVEAAILPVLARNPAYQPLLNPGSPLMTGGLGTAIGISLIITALGDLLLAWHLVDTGTISPANGFLFIGAPLIVLTPPLAHAFGVVGGLLLGAGVIWLGFSVRGGRAHAALESSLRVQDECLAHLGHA